ncbi:MAG: hypothetical protein HYY46_14395 [Deltaproteobacteria bacterium]|nr:hypothetical protein [Deltaproteobacteria bacterium]
MALVLMMGLAGCKGSVDHDEISAARSDMENGYALLSDSAKRYVSLEKFKEVLSQLHPKAFPAGVTATEYEPVPGEKAMHIFLVGENSGERFYYRLTMEGAATSGYRVSRFYRGGEPYPSSNQKKRFSK